VFTYQFPDATDSFNKASLIHYSLTDYSTLVELALEKGIIPVKQMEILLKWREYPANWTGVL